MTLYIVIYKFQQSEAGKYLIILLSGLYSIVYIIPFFPPNNPPQEWQISKTQRLDSSRLPSFRVAQGRILLGHWQFSTADGCI